METAGRIIWRCTSASATPGRTRRTTLKRNRTRPFPCNRLFMSSTLHFSLCIILILNLPLLLPTLFNSTSFNGATQFWTIMSSRFYKFNKANPLSLIIISGVLSMLAWKLLYVSPNCIETWNKFIQAVHNNNQSWNWISLYFVERLLNKINKSLQFLLYLWIDSIRSNSSMLLLMKSILWLWIC